MHAECWSRPEIAFAVTRLAQLTAAPNRIGFEWLKRVARFLYKHDHRPIMYPRMPLDGSYVLRNNYDSVNYAEIEVPNSIALFANAGLGTDMRSRRSMDSIMTALLGVLVDWQAKLQGPLALSLTDSEVRVTYGSVKRADYFYQLQRFLDMPAANKPIPIYQDSQPCIDILSSGEISKRVKHIALPVHFVYEKIMHGVVRLVKIPTSLQPADPGTKAMSAPVIFRVYDQAIGARFYPPAASDHASLMDLASFGASRQFVFPSEGPVPLESPLAEQW